MSKKEQLEVNMKVLEAFDRYNGEINGTFFHNAKRLRTCKAYVYETPSFYVLRSYNTVVAIIDKSTDTCYDFLRLVYGYSATSAMHISKFDSDFGSGKYGCKERVTYREV